MNPVRIACLLAVTPWSYAFAATPLNDTDLGHVHIAGGTVLATRAPADPVTLQTQERRTDRIIRDETPPVVHERVEMNRCNGDTQIVFQAQDQHLDVSPTGNALTSGVRLVNGNRIDSIVVLDAGGPGANRGDFGLQDLSISHTIRISPGPAR